MKVWDLRQEIAFYMDSEGNSMSFLMLRGSQIVFLVDVTEKFNYLNAPLQAGLRSRCRKESGIVEWSRILNNTRSRIFSSHSGSPTESFITSHSKITNPNSCLLKW